MSYERAIGVQLDTWWYVVPGQSMTNGTLGTDYFNTPDGVAQYCKDNNYYGNMTGAANKKGYVKGFTSSINSMLCLTEEQLKMTA